MLEVGNSDNGAGPVTDVENQSHFSLWAIASAPLIAGNNLFDVNMSAATKTILTNKEIIAIDQDAMGLQGVRDLGERRPVAVGKPLNANGARAAVLFNEGDAAADMTVKFADLGLAPRHRHRARPARRTPTWDRSRTRSRSTSRRTGRRR